ncbi:MAG: hypothetical protein PHQ43_00965 [Dehalococcoidales bacterium]|nr:hypothetical protein [Dehalococcoidales bacterium]
MKQYLTAEIQAFSQDEIMGIVDPTALNRIKARDEHPEIRVYSIGHEGKSNLHLPGIGNKTITWVQAAVRWIADKLQLNTVVFDRHDPTTNSHEGRIPIGEVVGKAVKEVGNRLNTLAAIYVYPQHKSRPLDVASIEAEMEFDHDGVQAWPTSVNSVTGIALSNSGIDSPGFPGATLLGAVQAFAVQAFGSDTGGNKMNLADVRQAVKDLGFKPSQVFDEADITSDPVVEKHVKATTKEHFEMANRVGTERDKLRDKVATLENEKADLGKQLSRATTMSKSTTLLDTVLADPNRKLDDKAKAFIKRSMKTFQSEATDEEGLKADLGKFIDSAKADYDELARDVFGTGKGDGRIPDVFTLEGQKNDQKQDSQNQYTHPVTQSEKLEAEMDMATNPFIPGSKATMPVV